jgi:hypothetical protein
VTDAFDRARKQDILVVGNHRPEEDVSFHCHQWSLVHLAVTRAGATEEKILLHEVSVAHSGVDLYVYLGKVLV